MENDDLTPKGHSQSHWRLLGQAELSIDATSQRSSHSWLLHVLVPISPPEDIANKIQLSLDETISQSLVPTRVEVRIFISEDVQAGHSFNRNWGYFKLEKIGNNEEAEHSLDYYIYLEK